MTLETGGMVRFEDRRIQGTPASADATPAKSLILDGQQRITSLYQACMRKNAIQIKTSRNEAIRRWLYIDMERAIDPTGDREDAIIGVREDKTIRTNFGKHIELDLTTSEREYEEYMFPLNRVFDYDQWQQGFITFHDHRKETTEFFWEFKNHVIKKFEGYQVPVISLDKETKLEAVCLVFQKVNTGGMSLDTFELVTAMYAAQGFNLREDWLGTLDRDGRQERLRDFSPLLECISSTDFLQVASLLHTKSQWRIAKSESNQDLPVVTAKRQSLLKLPLDAYLRHRELAQRGLEEAARFLHQLKIFRVGDIPYRTQLVPLAAILAELSSSLKFATVRNKLARWYWCGVFGELYGSATETRSARDMVEVPAWVDGDDQPSTVAEALFSVDRMDSLRTRRSAAFKGLNALLMVEGARDFRSGQKYSETVFFDDAVDIHHIFPRHWCEGHGIAADQYNSIVNKAPLSSSTNRTLGGDAPSRYLRRLEGGAEPIPTETIDAHLRTHLIDPVFLRNNKFDEFYEARKSLLCSLIENAMGKKAFRGHEAGEGNA